MSRSITENCVSHIEERGKIAPPSAHHKWIECYFKLLLCVAKPYIGEVTRRDGGVKQYNRTIFLTPLLRNYRSFGLSPIFPYGNTGEKVEYFLSYRQNHIIKECLKKPPLPCPVTLQGVTYKIGAEAKGKYISPSSSAVPRSITGCFAQQNIGEVSEGRRG